MSISSIVTRGYGSWGSANLVVTRGYSIGEDSGEEETTEAKRLIHDTLLQVILRKIKSAMEI